MISNSNSNNNTENVVKVITVNLKFEKDSSTNKIIGFVTHLPYKWMGCRSTDNVQKKKIVLIGSQMKETIIPGVLYRTKIRRAKYCGNFIAISAKPVQFEGIIATKIDDDAPQLILTFGGKKIIYNPASTDPMFSSLDKIASTIAHRYDIKDADSVAQRFYCMGMTLKQEF